MLRDVLRFALSFLLVALSIPLLAVAFLIAALCATVVPILPGFPKRNHADAIALQKLQAVDEFGFENAVTAYEDLIGAYVWRQP
ncbi:MAG: hypothetical protein WAL45_00240 [Terracidiphilus sp.]